MRKLPWPGLLALFALSLASASHAEDQRPPQVALADPNVCVTVRASARYVGYGYTHTVVISNGCPKVVECSVWTDVDPEPRTTVQLKPKESREHVTRSGSPASAVVAGKSCRFR